MPERNKDNVRLTEILRQKKRKEKEKEKTISYCTVWREARCPKRIKGKGWVASEQDQR